MVPRYTPSGAEHGSAAERGALGVLDLLPPERVEQIAAILSAVLGAPARWAGRGAVEANGDPATAAAAEAAGGIELRLVPGDVIPEGHPLVLADARSAEGSAAARAAIGEDAGAVLVVPLPSVVVGSASALAIVTDAPREWGAPVVFAVERLAAWLAAELRFRSDVLHDGVTGLPNRALFLDRVAHAATRARRHEDFRFAVVALELDRYALVVDSLGPRAGDLLLSEVARRVAACVRSEDMVARFGSDKFGLLLESLSDDADAGRVAERIYEALVAPFAIEAEKVYATPSMGIVLSSSGLDSAPTMMQRAIIAMTRSTPGRGRYEIFDRAMHERARARLRAETDLRLAVERGEFELYYQPLVTLDEGRITEVEALLRWRHPERGIVPPLDFIPLAEEMGLIVPIGAWVLREACRQTREWQMRLPDGAGLSVSVNLSARQLVDSDFTGTVSEALRETGLDPRALKLEITESVLIEDPDRARAMLAALRALGVKIYLDDFGTGYSSLRYLHQLPLDAIKIDRSFVSLMDTGTKHLQVVHTVRELARNIGVQAVAEGVENTLQLELLRTLQCESAQGFLFSRPVPAEEIERMLVERPSW